MMVANTHNRAGFMLGIYKLSRASTVILQPENRMEEADDGAGEQDKKRRPIESTQMMGDIEIEKIGARSDRQESGRLQLDMAAKRVDGVQQSLIDPLVEKPQ